MALHWIGKPVGYPVITHASTVARKIRGQYTVSELKSLSRVLRPITAIRVSAAGAMQAADRRGVSGGDPTHYDAIWVRDSMWGYLSVRLDDAPAASRMLRFLLRYFATPAQRGRMLALQAPHIRFDGRSPSYADVRVNGRAQPWNHRQNDALGLFLAFAFEALIDGQLGSLEEMELDALALLPAYLQRAHFHEMEDAGCWEEIDRVSTSSIGCVIAGLERALAFIEGAGEGDRRTRRRFLARAKALGLAREWSARGLVAAIRAGYRRLRLQLAAGGESPLYPRSDPRHRTCDAALLNLVYPASLSEFSLAEKVDILECVRPLIGEVGIRRYFGDSYQCANFWTNPRFHEPRPKRKLDPAADFVARGRLMVPGTEAQWFFDSWWSVAWGLLNAEKPSARFLQEQIKGFNRALGYVTRQLELPESYNWRIRRDRHELVPSPISPLNWAKAALRLAMEQMTISINHQEVRS